VRISAKADYAVRAAIELARAHGGDRPTKGEAIAQAQEIPLKFLENILADLRHAGLVRSQRRAGARASPTRVDRADEAHHELVGRLARRARAARRSARCGRGSSRRSVGDLHRLLLVVRDEHRRHVHLVVQPAQPARSSLRTARRARRTARRAAAPSARPRARARAPCAGAGRPRAARDSGSAKLLELDELEQLVDALADLAFGRLRISSARRRRCRDGHVLEGGVVLEDEADAALLRREPVASSPSMTTSPASGCSRPAMTRSSVDLPPPLGPSSAVSEPSGSRARRRRARRSRRSAS
jgi:hypothetical protein